MFARSKSKLTLLPGLLLLPGWLCADVHRFTVEDAELRIYPADIPLTLHQQHAVLHELALEMQQGTAQDRADFTRTALYEMAVLYEEAANRQGEDEKIQPLALLRWRNETRKLARELYRAADTVDPDTPIDISIADTGDVHLLVNQKLYILSSPLINEPYLLDERIINNICRIKYCDQENPAIQQTAGKRTITIEANWIIVENEKPRYVTSDGLNFMFIDLENRSLKQIASLKVIKEIKLVAETLGEAGRKGVVIEWDTLTIKPFQGSYDYRIHINRFGDTVYIKLPELHHVTNWQEQVLPWVRAQVEEKEIDQYLDADEFLSYAIDKKK